MLKSLMKKFQKKETSKVFRIGIQNESGELISGINGNEIHLNIVGENITFKNQNGHNTVFYGEEPDKFQEGDLWYSKNGSYNVARWINHELKMDPIFTSE